VSEILNLRRFRKAKARAAAADAAAANRVRFGLSRAERDAAEQKSALELRRLEGHRLVQERSGLASSQSGGNDETESRTAPENPPSSRDKTSDDDAC
jgi:hypothetical protein